MQVETWPNRPLCVLITLTSSGTPSRVIVLCIIVLDLILPKQDASQPSAVG